MTADRIDAPIEHGALVSVQRSALGYLVQATTATEHATPVAALQAVGDALNMDVSLSLGPMWKPIEQGHPNDARDVLIAMGPPRPGSQAVAFWTGTTWRAYGASLRSPVTAWCEIPTD